MSELRLSPHEGWATALVQAASRIALGGMARGVVAGSLRSRLPQAYEQGLADVGTVVPTVATEAGVLVVETLVDYGPARHEPITYV